LTLTFDPAIRHIVLHQSSTSTCVPNFIQIEETFCGRTDVWTGGRTFFPSMLLGRLWEVDLKIWCKCVHALLRYRSKTTKMQKFPIDSYSNENFISSFSARRGPLTPKRGEDTSGTRVRQHAKLGLNRPAGCREIVDKKNEQTKKNIQ